MHADQVKHWLEILEVVLIASVKFLIAPFDAERNGFNFGESFLITTSGGLLGIFVFYYAGANITHWWRKIVVPVKAFFLRKPVAEIAAHPRRIFTRTRRLIVRVKNKFGLAGLAFITPSIISIPIGTAVAADIFRKRRPVLLYLSVSLILWSLLLNWIAQELKLSQYIPSSDH